MLDFRAIILRKVIESDLFYRVNTKVLFFSRELCFIPLFLNLIIASSTFHVVSKSKVNSNNPLLKFILTFLLLNLKRNCKLIRELFQLLRINDIFVIAESKVPRTLIIT